VSPTVPFKFVDDLALTQKVSLAIANVGLDMGEVIYEVAPLRPHSRPPCPDG